MFDIGFTELLLIGVVTLLVLGPERLPKVARTAGAWFGRVNRYVGEVQRDITREMKLDEFRQMQQEMHERAVQNLGFARETQQLVEQEADHLDMMMRGMIATTPAPDMDDPMQQPLGSASADGGAPAGNVPDPSPGRIGVAEASSRP